MRLCAIINVVSTEDVLEALLGLARAPLHPQVLAACVVHKEPVHPVPLQCCASWVGVKRDGFLGSRSVPRIFFLWPVEQHSIPPAASKHIQRVTRSLSAHGHVSGCSAPPEGSLGWLEVSWAMFWVTYNKHHDNEPLFKWTWHVRLQTYNIIEKSSYRYC